MEGGNHSGKLLRKTDGGLSDSFLTALTAFLLDKYWLKGYKYA